MPTDLEIGLYVFLLGTLLGAEVIRQVPKLLHTPLMALTNAISGVALVGSLVVAGSGRSPLSTWLGVAAVAASTINVVGGFMITDRMLRMFRSRRQVASAPVSPGHARREPLLLAAGAIGYLLAAALVVTALRWASAGSAAVASAMTSVAYLAAAALFVLALKWLTDPRRARRGVRAGELGMLLAVAGTLVKGEVVSFEWIVPAVLAGSVIGALMALFMPMTAMPQRIALSHAFGALAAALVGSAHYHLEEPRIGAFTQGALGLEVLLGFLTFTGSLMAFGKLQGILPDRPIVYRGQNVVNIGILAAAVALGAYLVVSPGASPLFTTMSLLALVFGVLLIIPIGGADMPTVISLLNSYAGLSGAAMGFVLRDNVLIVAGALDGASGLLLSIIMCRAMNRSFGNVLFGAFGRARPPAARAAPERSVRSATADEAAELLDAARSVIVVPGYGMAVAQAQHKVHELARLLARRGVDVQFAIHPVAGRMPGHMNVLLAEANIPYEQLHDLDEINAEFDRCDVALVIGANDVVNPAARHDTTSPLYGMPILDVDHARTVMVVKRSLAPGFAGIENELFHDPKTLMLFGDARDVVARLVEELSRQEAAPELRESR
jgi:NAD(P) transhydrogenase subunit beta